MHIFFIYMPPQSEPSQKNGRRRQKPRKVFLFPRFARTIDIPLNLIVDQLVANDFYVRKHKDLRTEKDIGQIELAEKLQVSRGIISLWENGLREPTLPSLIRIATFFGVTLDYLAGLSDYER